MRGDIERARLGPDVLLGTSIAIAGPSGRQSRAPEVCFVTSRWLRRWNGVATPALRLICFPYAGGGASMFNRWRLPDELDAEIWAVQPPGREARRGEEPLRRLEPAIVALALEIRPLLDRPFAFFGHSMGALLAFELCRYLRRSGAPEPVRLLVSAHRAPDLPPWRPPASRLPDREFLARLTEMAGPSRVAAVNAELLSALAPTIRADFELCETYAHVAEEPLSIPLTCFAAVDDPEVRVDEMTAWRRHSSAGCQIYPFVGGHLFIRDQAEDVLDRIAADLDLDDCPAYGGVQQ
ncbi:thioesterase II family protein [Dactylosporangium sp. CA-139066]|uniref:thioesterase II family protein n=1 Tax=Dactylosporangium sp. CA-139066 TaxID=3239930 RepID=UPI003D91515C